MSSLPKVSSLREEGRKEEGRKKEGRKRVMEGGREGRKRERKRKKFFLSHLWQVLFPDAVSPVLRNGWASLPGFAESTMSKPTQKDWPQAQCSDLPKSTQAHVQ